MKYINLLKTMRYINLLATMKYINLLKTMRNDQCDLCVAAELGNIPKEQYDAHTDRKQKAQAEKMKDKAETGIDFGMDDGSASCINMPKN
ncbi:hypothetical protein ElyMa_003229700 [Elysia marginata]|uniref:Uncharacterized protein n=1 Tax=Elysia marginata TaxID=1093978 RepID=A0AAV4J5W8_9GAST|nr:hypothetical protein ElyMa_003229700 [Elysia marginata]